MPAGSAPRFVQQAVFGGGFVNGLRGAGQNLHWITDDDSIVSTEHAAVDAMELMGGLLHSFPDEYLQIGLGIASKFDDDRRAEDLTAIPDLAAGAFSELISRMGKSAMPTLGAGPNKKGVFLQTKSTLINTWRSEAGTPLKHLNLLIRVAEGGQTLFSWGTPVVRQLRSTESAADAPEFSSKWRKALEADMKSRGIDRTVPNYLGEFCGHFFL